MTLDIDISGAYCMERTMKRKLYLLKKPLSRYHMLLLLPYYAIILWKCFAERRRHKIKSTDIKSLCDMKMACAVVRQQAKKIGFIVQMQRNIPSWFQLKRQQSNRFLCLCVCWGRIQLTCNYFITVISSMKPQMTITSTSTTSILCCLLVMAVYGCHSVRQTNKI